MKNTIITVLLGLSCCFLSNKTQAQDMLPKMEDSLVNLADSIYRTPVPEMRIDVNIRFGKMLVRALEQPNSYNYPFEQLAKKIRIIYPEDKSFRIFKWVVPYSDFGRRYYAAIQQPGEKLVLSPLKDVSEKHVKDGQDVALTNGEWFGGEIYRIRAVTDAKGRKIYTLFTYNNDGLYTTKKIADAMVFEEGKPVFNLPIFALPDAKNAQDFKMRFILEYKKEIQTSLNYNDEQGVIVFDRLASEVNNPSVKSTYIPTGQNDGLQWTGSIWKFVSSIIKPMKLKDGQAPLDGVMSTN